MHIKRLRRLEALLRKDAKRKRGITFDMGVWGEVNLPEKVVDRMEESGRMLSGAQAKKYITMNCNTRACALGLAAISGEFPSLTIKVDIAGDVVPYYRGQNGLHAGIEAFELTDRQACWLFMPSSYGDSSLTGAEMELQVADRIHDMIKAGCAPGEESGEEWDYAI